jgi:hypothetical protein
MVWRVKHPYPGIINKALTLFMEGGGNEKRYYTYRGAMTRAEIEKALEALTGLGAEPSQNLFNEPRIWFQYRGITGCALYSKEDGYWVGQARYGGRLSVFTGLRTRFLQRFRPL